ncbi:MAG TPA: hypothetical protein VFI13_07175 [Gemmatimonadales bacterium]|nr:hypothetical protein [Gemmatimonadales bacterium]
MTWATSLRVPATLHFADGSEAAGAVHVQSAVAHHDGPETVVEMLNRPEPFLVLSFEESGVAFIPKAQVALIETAAPEADDRERISAARPLTLEVEMMVTARVIEGVAVAELPPTRARALDFLNDGGAFFPVQANATLWAVHRTHVRTVRPVD